ncbi:rCG52800 [Rattus norvegicus]|uniref:Leukocyte surface antigen CD47 n=1 Tax=Rattus norvegicus TaxID=10116 RepID=A6IQV0_RAT|nr:rCG52800 [Rattus norvegicus]
MWPLLVALLLGSFHCGLAQLLFKNISSVKIDHCKNIVLIPCYVSNLEAENINELFLKWKFGRNSDIIFVFDGYANKSAAFYKFSSAHIFPSEFLKGNASLNVAKEEVKNGKYTCEVTELSREGQQTVDLQYTDGSLFTLKEHISIIILPFLTLILFWAQFGILIQKYKSNPVNRKTIILFATGLLITIVVITGASLLIPAIGRTLHTVIMLTIIQAVGTVLTVAGLYHSSLDCVPRYGSILILGLAIVALGELFGLIYMKCFDPLIEFQ